MNRFLVSWRVSSIGNKGLWIKDIVTADTADEALLQDLIKYECISPNTTMNDIRTNKQMLDYGKANNLTYIGSIVDDQDHVEELQLVATDCGLQVFIPKNTLDGYIEEDYKPHAQPFRVSIIWTVGSIQHLIEDTVWAESIDMAAIDGVLSCLPAATDRNNENLFRKALEDSEDCSIEANGEHYALSKLEPLKHVTITIDEHRINALVPKNHVFGQAPILAKII